MTFAATAVLDVVAPPPRPAPARDAADAPSSNEPSFDDHVEAVAVEPDQTDPDKSPEPAAAECASAAPAQPVAAPITIHLAESAPQPAPQEVNAAPFAAPFSVEAPVAPGAAAASGDVQSQPPPAGFEKALAKSLESAAPPQAPASQTPQPVVLADDSAALAAKAGATEAPTQAAPTPPQAPSPQQPPKAASKTANADNLADTSDAPARVSEGAKPETDRPVKATTGKADPGVAFKPADEAPAAPANNSSAQPAAVPPLQSTPSMHQTALELASTRAAPTGAQIAREIIRRFDGASTTFDLRLDPPELGRVDVRLEVTRDQRVTAVIAADNPHALTELARHARELEQTLQSAGLELGENGLSFDLRQGERGARNREDGVARGGGDASVEPEAPQARPVRVELWRGARLDVTV